MNLVFSFDFLFRLKLFEIEMKNVWFFIFSQDLIYRFKYIYNVDFGYLFFSFYFLQIYLFDSEILMIFI